MLGDKWLLRQVRRRYDAYCAVRGNNKATNAFYVDFRAFFKSEGGKVWEMKEGEWKEIKNEGEIRPFLATKFRNMNKRN